MPAKKKKKPAKKKLLKKKPVKRLKAKKKAIRKKPSAKRRVKKPAKRSAKKPAQKPVKKPKKLPGNVVGLITHYFPKVMAAVIKLKTPLSVGDSVKIKGHTTDFVQQVTSMQIDHVAVTSAKKGDEIGLMVTSRVRHHDVVYKV